MAKRSTRKAATGKAGEMPAPVPSVGRPRVSRPDTLAGHLAEKIEAKRKAAGLTVAQVAAAAGVGVGTAFAVERGKTSPNLRTVVAIAHALGVSAAGMFNGIAEWTAWPG